MTLKKLAFLALAACAFGFSNERMDGFPAVKHILDTTWLTSAQKNELESLTDASRINEKFFGYYKALGNDKQRTVNNQIIEKCYNWLEEVATDAEITDLKKLHHANHAACKTKVREYLERLPSAEQIAIRNHLDACEAIWYGQHADHDYNRLENHHRRRRDHHHGYGHSLDDYLKTHLSWLTEAQGQQLKDLKAEGKTQADIQSKVLEFYDSATGEIKNKATELLQDGCRVLLKLVVGEEKASELKTLKESGASNNDISQKIEQFIAGVSDEHKVKLAANYGGVCKKVFGITSSRLRRHHDEHDVEHFAKEHLSWLTPEQKAEVMKLKGDKSAAKAKIHEFLDAATGETKAKAIEELKGACRHLLQHVLGDKFKIIMDLKKTGADKNGVKAKIYELIGQITNEHLKAEIEEHREDCEKLYGGVSRKRRAHNHKLQDFATKYLTWLNPDEKAEVLALEKQGKNVVKAKIAAFYEAADPETKEKANVALQSACRNHLVHVIGEEKATELKALKESGASKEEIVKKADELVASIVDPELKKEADEHREDCLKIFGVGPSARMRREHGRPHDHADEHDHKHGERGHEHRRRRDHHHGYGHSLDDYLKTHLSWLTEAQGQQLKDLKAEGKTQADIQSKVLEFYDSATGEIKNKATELLQDGCRVLLKLVVGEEKASELKTLKESGASNNDISQKIEQFIAGVSDEHRVKLAANYGGVCKKVFGITSSRLRRHHDEHDVEHFAKEHLSWLTPEQKAEVMKLKGDKSAAKAKIQEFLHAASGPVKAKAIEELQGACKHILRHVLGDKAVEVKQLMESGASNDVLKAKVDKLIADVTDPHLKKDAIEYKEDCYKLFAAPASRKRRHEGKSDLKDFVDNHLSWLTLEQKTAIKALKDAKNEQGVKSKVAEYYAAATGETKEIATAELQSACRELFADVLGDKAEDITKLKETGASKEIIAAKVDELLSTVTDESKKAKGLEYVQNCKRLFGVSSRKRRAFTPPVTHLDFFKQIVNENDLLEDVELAYAIMDIYDAEDLSENARETVVECHSLYAEISNIDKVLSEKSARELVYALRSVSNRQLKGIQAVTDICKKTVDKHRESGGESSFDDTIVSRLDNLKDAESVKRVWKEKCIDWITDVTSQEEQNKLKMLLRTKQRDVVTEQISYFMARFDAQTRKQIGHMRPVCEHLLFY